MKVIAVNSDYAVGTIIRCKYFFCLINFILAFIGLGLELTASDISVKVIIGLILLPLSIIVWNHWLYTEMFSVKNGRRLISYKSFELIGLSMAVIMFSAICYGLAQNI